MITLTVDYESHHNVEPWRWQGAKFKVTPCMDGSYIGMSFLYEFNSEEDAVAFKLLFGHCVK